MKPDRSSPAHILLVDDNSDGLLVRRIMLEEAGYSVVTARHAEQALERFSKSAFDVVVTDYRMPGMNGIELISRMRALDPNVRVVLISGLVEILGLNEENTGANAVVAKNSAEPAHLLRWVKRLANGAAQKKPVGSQRRRVPKSKTAGT